MYCIYGSPLPQSMYKWTHAVPTCVGQGSPVLYNNSTTLWWQLTAHTLFLQQHHTFPGNNFKSVFSGLLKQLSSGTTSRDSFPGPPWHAQVYIPNERSPRKEGYVYGSAHIPSPWHIIVAGRMKGRDRGIWGGREGRKGERRNWGGRREGEEEEGKMEGRRKKERCVRSLILVNLPACVIPNAMYLLLILAPLCLWTRSFPSMPYLLPFLMGWNLSPICNWF